MNRKHLVALAGAALLLSSSLRAAGPVPLLALPGTPAWQLGGDFVAVFNGGNAAALRRYLQEHLTPEALAESSLEERVAELRHLRATLGPVEVIEASGASHLVVLDAIGARGGTDFVLVVDTADPRRLAVLRAAPHGDDAVARGVLQ